MPLQITDTPSYFDNSSAQVSLNAQNITDRSDFKAVLYVFKPYARQFDDVGLRSFQYNWDDNFLGQAEELGDLRKRGTARPGMVVADLMNRVNLNDYMTLPQTPTFRMRTGLLSDRYRFILILTDNGQLVHENTFAATGPGNQLRRIYTGYFEDEPFNFNTFSNHHHTFNEDAFMVITHKTVVGTSMRSGQWGRSMALNTTSSEQILHPSAWSSFAAPGLNRSSDPHLVTPENCINGIEQLDNGSTVVIPGAYSRFTQDNAATTVADVLEQPAHNIGHVLTGVIRNQDQQIRNSKLSTYRSNHEFDEAYLETGLQQQRLGRFLGVPRSGRQSEFDLDENDRISAAQIDAMVNKQLHVVPFEKERPRFYETADQMEASINNQYSFMIASIVPALLSAAGLNKLDFEFEIAMRGNVPQEQFIVRGSEPHYPVPQADLAMMVKAVEVELVDGIFKTLFESLGDFYVMVMANTTQITTVRLILVGQGQRQGINFELPSCLGGLVTPLVGDDVTMANNSAAVSELFGRASGIPNARDTFDSNDEAFAAQALQYFGGNEHDWPAEGAPLTLRT